VPVPKRNFKKKHEHKDRVSSEIGAAAIGSCGDNKVNENDSTDGSGGEEEDYDYQSNQGTSVSGQVGQNPAPKPTSDTSLSSVLVMATAAAARADAEAAGTAGKIRLPLAHSAVPAASSLQSSDGGIRPTKSKELLDEIMASALSKDPFTGTMADRQKEWGDLLLARPASTLNNKDSDAMLSWIHDVLRVSDLGDAIGSAFGAVEADSNNCKVELSPATKMNKRTLPPKKRQKVDEENFDQQKPSESSSYDDVPKEKEAAMDRDNDEEIIDQQKPSESSAFGDEAKEKEAAMDGDNDEVEESEEDEDESTEEKEEEFPDDVSTTTSEDSVDLMRVRKRAR